MPIYRRRTPYRNRRTDQAWGQNFTVNSASPQANDLIAWWPFLAQPWGNTFYEKLGRHGPATLQNSPTWIRSDERGAALSFVAESNEYVDLGTTALLNYDGISIVLWASLTTVPGEGFSVFDWDDGGNWRCGWYSNNRGWGTRRVGSAVRDDYNPVGLETTGGGWQCYVFTYEASSAVKTIYKSGRLLGSKVAIHGAGQLNMAGVDFIALCSTGDGYEAYGITIGEFRTYNRVLTLSEAWALWDPSTRWDLYLPTKRTYFVGALRTPRYGFTLYQTPGIV